MPRRRVAKHEIRYSSVAIGFAVLTVATACSYSDPTPALTPTSPAQAVQPMSFDTSATAHCTWVPAPSSAGHAVPGTEAGSHARWEMKICGAPPGDTSGMGGPVDWREVPHAAASASPSPASPAEG